MPTILYTLDKQIITLHIRQNTKKNIILRPHHLGSLKLSIPSWFTQADLINWLNNNHAALQKMLNHSTFRQPENTLPENIWWYGKPCRIHISSNTQAQLDNTVFRLPEQWTTQQQRTWLQQFLFQAAQQQLLPLLAQHSIRLQLKPTRMNLTHAKTFWGICRPHTGIRLNWRLIGAPKWVQEYVCIHELCHLAEPNHSPAFWAKVHAATPYTHATKAWLKTHGKELFTLG